MRICNVEPSSFNAHVDLSGLIASNPVNRDFKSRFEFLVSDGYRAFRQAFSVSSAYPFHALQEIVQPSICF